MGFTEYLRRAKQSPKYPREYDEAIHCYIAESKLTVSYTEGLIAAVEKVWPQLKWKLIWSRAKLASMEKSRQIKYTIPMDFNCCLALAWWIAMTGKPRVAGVLILQWVCGLRPSEALALEGQMLTLPETNPSGGAAAIVTLQPRTGTKSRRPQFALLHEAGHPEGMAILRRFVYTTPRGTRLSSVTTTTEYNRLLEKASAALRLPRFGAHSPRAGGATAQRLRGIPFTEIQELGRWESAASCRRYLDALAALQTAVETNHITDSIHWLREEFCNRYCWWP